MRFIKVPQRLIALPLITTQSDPKFEAATNLFGHGESPASSTNIHLKGVVVSTNPDESIVILSVNGKATQTARINTEISPAISIKEIHKGYIVLSDNGSIKKIELPQLNHTSTNH
jgi:general secretion pathway protein C